MKIYLSVADNYFAYESLYKLLNQLQIQDIIICDKINEEHLHNLRGKLKLEIIKKNHLYNVLRTDIDLVFICTDGEDSQSIYLTKYCVNHRLPLVLLTNIVEPSTYLEVV